MAIFITILKVELGMLYFFLSRLLRRASVFLNGDFTLAFESDLHEIRNLSFFRRARLNRGVLFEFCLFVCLLSWTQLTKSAANRILVLFDEIPPLQVHTDITKCANFELFHFDLVACHLVFHSGFGIFQIQAHPLYRYI